MNKTFAKSEDDPNTKTNSENAPSSTGVKKTTMLKLARQDELLLRAH